MIVHDGATGQALPPEDPKVATAQLLTMMLLFQEDKSQPIKLSGSSWLLAVDESMPEGRVDLVSSDGTRYRITNIGLP